MRYLVSITALSIAAGPLVAKAATRAQAREQERAQASERTAKDAALARLSEKHGVSHEDLARFDEEPGLDALDVGYVIAVAKRAGRPLREVADLRLAGAKWRSICGRFGLDHAAMRSEAVAFEHEAREPGLFEHEGVREWIEGRGGEPGPRPSRPKPAP